MGTFECCRRMNDIPVNADKDKEEEKKIQTASVQKKKNYSFPYSVFLSKLKDNFYIYLNIKSLSIQNDNFNLEEYSYDDFCPSIEIYINDNKIDTLIYNPLNISDDEDNIEDEQMKFIFDIKKNYPLKKAQFFSCLRFVIKNAKNDIVIGKSSLIPISMFSNTEKKKNIINILQGYNIIFELGSVIGLCRNDNNKGIVEELLGDISDIEDNDEEVSNREIDDLPKEFFYYEINKGYNIENAMVFIDEIKSNNSNNSPDIGKIKHFLNECVEHYSIKNNYYLTYELFRYVADYFYHLKKEKISLDDYEFLYNEVTMKNCIYDYSEFYLMSIVSMIHFQIEKTKDEKVILPYINIILDIMSNINYRQGGILELSLNILSNCLEYSNNSYALSIKLIQSVLNINSILKSIIEPSSSIILLSYLKLIIKIVQILKDNSTPSSLTQSLIINEDYSFSILSLVLLIIDKLYKFPLLVSSGLDLLLLMEDYIDKKMIDKLIFSIHHYHSKYSREIDKEINKNFIEILKNLFIIKKTIDEAQITKCINMIYDISNTINKVDEEQGGYSKIIGECYQMHINIIEIIMNIKDKKALNINFYNECLVILSKLSERISDTGLDIITEILSMNKVSKEDISNNIINLLNLLISYKANNNNHLSNSIDIKQMSSDLILYLKSQNIPGIDQISSLFSSLLEYINVTV